MAKSSFAPAIQSDLLEIPAYVIRPARAAGSRYSAPRLSRASFSLRELREMQRRSWSQRLVNGWRRHRGLDVGPNEADPVTELRYQSAPRVPLYMPVSVQNLGGARPLMAPNGPIVAPRFMGRGIAAVALCAAAGALGWAFGTQMMPASASATRMIPASVLIAGQNMATKLPKIEQRAGSLSGLEQGHRVGQITYIVRPGDSFKGIGQRFGLTARSVRLVNQLALGARLRPGQHLLITPTDGAMYTCRAGEEVDDIAKRYELQSVALIAANAGLKAGPVTIGQTLFIPGAQEIRLPVPQVAGGSARGYRNDHNEGSSNARLTASRSLIGEFGNRVGSLSWPAAGQISSPFGVRGYSFHPGMDICNAVGTPVHAAKAGVILSAGWSGGYGYAIDIDHGGGVVTRYGHCSRLLCAAGQKVAVGEQIALMGSTGHSTGPHVHFEVRIQGRAVNPAGFL
jgi:murein DD-endopeptidase MepM/ murein hydrolase activator NlpD